MSVVTSTDTDFVRAWETWQAARWDAVSSPHGIAALAATIWLTPDESPIDGVSGLWRGEGDTVVGADLAGGGLVDADGSPVDDVVVLRAGDTLAAGDRLLRAFVRDGAPALRILDPQHEARLSLTGITASPPDPSWVVPARVARGEAPLDVELVDGHRTVHERSTELDLDVAGTRIRLTATVGPEALSVVFADATSGAGSYRFRFLRVPLPDDDGDTVVDLNRAFLPPCAFSPHYVCPLPPPGNRLSIAIDAGERLPLHG